MGIKEGSTVRVVLGEFENSMITLYHAVREDGCAMQLGNLEV